MDQCNEHPDLPIEARVRKAREGCGSCSAWVFERAHEYLTKRLTAWAHGDMGLAAAVVEQNGIPRVQKYVLDGSMPLDKTYDADQDFYVYLNSVGESSWYDYHRSIWRPIFDGTDDDCFQSLQHRSAKGLLDPASLHENGIPESASNVVRHMYALGHQAAVIAASHGLTSTQVYKTAGKFRDAVTRPVCRLMGAVGFSADQVQLVVGLRIAFFAALRLDARAIRAGSRGGQRLPRIQQLVRRLARKCRAPVQKVLQRFREIVQSPLWEQSAQLQDLKVELLDGLRDDVDWIPFEFSAMGLSQETIVVYVRFWRGQRPWTIHQHLRKDPQFENKWQQMAARLSEVKHLGNLGEEYFLNLPYPVREWYESTTGQKSLSDLRSHFAALVYRDDSAGRCDDE